MLRFNRGERLYQTKRLKHKRKNYYGHHRIYSTKGIQYMNPVQLGKVSQYPTMCSCFMCSGSTYRKAYGNSARARTHQELKWLAYSESF